MNRFFSTRSSAALAVALVCSASAFAQATAEVQASRGVAGVLDPVTGVFTSLPFRGAAMAPDAIPDAATTVTGTLKFVFTIAVKSGIPTTSTIGCSGTATLIAPGASGTPQSYTETKAIAATRSGSTATCSVSIPYSWILTTTSGAQVALSYQSGTVDVVGTTAMQRSQYVSLGTITLPANGATTTKNLSVTL